MGFLSRPSLFSILIPLIVLVLTAFGPGLLQVAIAPYFMIALSILYLDRLGPWSKASILPNLYLYLCLDIGTAIAYAGMLQQDTWDNSLLLVPFVVGLAVALAILIPLWTSLAWNRRFLEKNGQERFQNGASALVATLVAPTVWVGLFTAIYAISPLGSYGSIAYTQAQVEAIVQWASVAGIAGIEFFVVWASVILHRAWKRYMYKVEQLQHDQPHQQLQQQQQQQQQQQYGQQSSTTSSSSNNSSNTIKSQKLLFRRSLVAPTPVFFVVVLFIWTYGAMRAWNVTTFFQRPLHDTILPTVKTSCVIGASSYDNMPQYINSTLDLAKTGSQIVIWSESAVNMYNATQLSGFLQQASNISATYGIYLGVTYSEYVENGLSKNMFTLLDPLGQVSWKYQKAHPVATVETDVIAGPNVLPTVDTPGFGRLGGAICFDMDFPRFIAQAGSKNVNLLLQPSWTWGSIGKLESVMQSYRAVEQGLTLFRCGSWAPSTVYDTYHQLYAYKEMEFSGTMTVDVPLRPHVKTIFSVVGNVWAYICVAFGIVILLLVLLPVKWVYGGLEKVEEIVFQKIVPGRHGHGRQPGQLPLHSTDNSTAGSTMASPVSSV